MESMRAVSDDSSEYQECQDVHGGSISGPPRKIQWGRQIVDFSDPCTTGGGGWGTSATLLSGVTSTRGDIQKKKAKVVHCQHCIHAPKLTRWTIPPGVVRLHVLCIFYGCSKRKPGSARRLGRRLRLSRIRHGLGWC